MNDITLAEVADWIGSNLPLILAILAGAWATMKFGVRQLMNNFEEHYKALDAKVDQRHHETQGELKGIRAEMERMNGNVRENRDRSIRNEAVLKERTG